MVKRSVTQKNWMLHGYSMGALAVAWVVMVVRERNGGFSEGLTDIIGTFLALAYAIASTILLWTFQKKRFGVAIAHGTVVVGVLAAFLFEYVTHI